MNIVIKTQAYSEREKKREKGRYSGGRKGDKRKAIEWRWKCGGSKTKRDRQK